jgi:hypothetical protein
VEGRGLDSFGSEYGPMMGSCDYCNKPFGSIEDREFLNRLNVLLASEGLRSTELVIQ